jgi:hypothetical protein
VLTWILFILATLASQVVMFNTLIAILGDTFSKIMERRLHHAIKAKTEMYADFMFLEKYRPTMFKKEKYIYVIVPVNDDEEQQWEGVVTTIKRRVQNLKDTLTKDNKTTVD